MGAIATKVCKACGVTKPLHSFAKGKYIGGRRHQCNRCSQGKNRRDWERTYRQRVAAASEGRAGFEQRACGHCERLFWFKSASDRRIGRRAGVYCSVRCRDEHRRRTLTCPTCGIAFTVWRCAEGERKYCSKKCAGVIDRKRPVICEYCGQATEPIILSAAKDRRYCSRACGAMAKRKHIRDRKRYGGAAWHELRDSIIRRDGGVCKSCGTTDDLHVHHKVRWRAGGSDDPDNLITLCKICHAVVHCQSGDIPAYFAQRT